MHIIKRQVSTYMAPVFIKIKYRKKISLHLPKVHLFNKRYFKTGFGFMAYQQL